MRNWSVASKTYLLEVKDCWTPLWLESCCLNKTITARIHWTTDQIKNRWRNLKAAHKRYMAESQIATSVSDPNGRMHDLFWERQQANMICYGVENLSEAPDPTEEGSGVTGELSLDSYRLRQNISRH